jgi:hypothetical protein
VIRRTFIAKLAVAALPFTLLPLDRAMADVDNPLHRAWLFYYTACGTYREAQNRLNSANDRMLTYFGYKLSGLEDQGYDTFTSLNREIQEMEDIVRDFKPACDKARQEFANALVNDLLTSPLPPPHKGHRPPTRTVNRPPGSAGAATDVIVRGVHQGLTHRHRPPNRTIRGPSGHSHVYAGPQRGTRVGPQRNPTGHSHTTRGGRRFYY